MKLGEFIAALEKFFNDILGTLVPGAILIIGLYYLDALWAFDLPLVDFTSSFNVFLMGIVAYLVGHIIDEINLKIIPKSKFKLEENSSFLVFKAWVHAQLKEKKIDKNFDNSEITIEIPPRSLRSIAMTVSADATYISRRFRFLQLLFRGTATALIMLTILSFVFEVLGLFFGHKFGLSLLVQSVLVIGVATLFYNRARVFGERSDKACFDCAIATIIHPEKG